MTAPTRPVGGPGFRVWTAAAGSALRDALQALLTDRARRSAEQRIVAYVGELGQTLSALDGRAIAVHAMPRGPGDRPHLPALSVTVADGERWAAFDVVFARHHVSIADRSFAHGDMDRALEELTRLVAVALFTDGLDGLRGHFKAIPPPE